MENGSILFFLFSINLSVLATTAKHTTGTWFQKISDCSENAYDVFNKNFHQCSMKEECNFLVKNLKTKVFKIVFEEKDLPTNQKGFVVWRKMRKGEYI